jgi:hypothetical protein
VLGFSDIAPRFHLKLPHEAQTVTSSFLKGDDSPKILQT